MNAAEVFFQACELIGCTEWVWTTFFHPFFSI